ncbi:MAG TPA: serine/threonine-protein kinase [Acidimicrobiia bacterium]|nr:serine/threonine-protein kinase [Acidimicrobiia bacterium]
MRTAAGQSRPHVLLDRYEIEGPLGAGATGEVYRAYDTRLLRPVAVKLLRVDLGASRAVRRRFEGEARAAARLAHPNVVTVYDSGEERGRAFIVMERLTGRTLADEIAEGPFAGTQVRRLADALLDALEAAHGAGILHRDVKPSNVLVAGRGRWKLTDFGIAKIIDETDATATGLVVGTPSYLAPERHLGAPATVRSDLYSLGVVLYEAATGDRPFRGEDAHAVANAVVHGTPASLATRRPELDGPLADAIDRAMAPDPADRFASADQMRQALDASADLGATIPLSTATSTATMHRPVARHHRPEPPSRVRARRPTRPAWRLVALAAAVVGVVIVGLVLLLGPSSSTPATPPATTPPTVSNRLPPPLDQALTRLQEAVQP